VHVTHDQDEAFAVADLVGVMEAGRLVQLDAPARLWSHPVDAGVVELLGQGPVIAVEAMDAWFGVRVDGPVALARGALVAGGGVGADSGDVGEGGLDVEVVSARFVRGHGELEVRLPDGRLATVFGDAGRGERLRVTVDCGALVRVGSA
jgi:thiamine transport system ATP-binding protein